MKILMVFGCKEDLRLWLRECHHAGTVRMPRESVCFADGSELLCRVIWNLESCEALAGYEFSIVLYHKTAQVSQAAREWLKSRIRNAQGELA